MPEHPHAQQRDAAQRSARKRVTQRLVRELAAARPLTRAQRAEILAAATGIRTVEDAR